MTVVERRKKVAPAAKMPSCRRDRCEKSDWTNDLGSSSIGIGSILGASGVDRDGCVASSGFSGATRSEGNCCWSNCARTIVSEYCFEPNGYTAKLPRERQPLAVVIVKMMQVTLWFSNTSTNAEASVAGSVEKRKVSRLG